MAKHGESFLQNDPQNFSLVLGGPLFQLLRRSHLTDDALGLLKQRIIAISLFCWLPLLVLSALGGTDAPARASKKVVGHTVLGIVFCTRWACAGGPECTLAIGLPPPAPYRASTLLRKRQTPA
jgi:hypothetical protein